MENVDEKMTSLLTELGEINDRLSNLNDAQTKIEKELSELQSKVDEAFNLQNEVNKSKEKLATALEQLENTTQKLVKLQEKADSLAEAVNALDLDKLVESVDKACEGFDAYQAKIKKDEQLKKKAEKEKGPIQKSASGKGKK